MSNLGVVRSTTAPHVFDIRARIVSHWPPKVRRVGGHARPRGVLQLPRAIVYFFKRYYELSYASKSGYSRIELHCVNRLDWSWRRP